MQVKSKAPEVTQQVDVRPPPLAASWNSDEDTPAIAATDTAALEGMQVRNMCSLESLWFHADSKTAASSKSLDDLLTLDSTAPLPKLDLLPLKADIGEIMMAGEDDSNDEQQ